VSVKWKAGRAYANFGCSAHHGKGAAICGNGRVISERKLNRAVIDQRENDTAYRLPTRVPGRAKPEEEADTRDERADAASEVHRDQPHKTSGAPTSAAFQDRFRDAVDSARRIAAARSSGSAGKVTYASGPVRRSIAPLGALSRLRSATATIGRKGRRLLPSLQSGGAGSCIGPRPPIFGDPTRHVAASALAACHLTCRPRLGTSE
jgi:hypothetical protein